MSDHLQKELKREFQVERLILFSDAVFAIAITLLVIEIKVPEVHVDVTDRLLLHELKLLIPKFIGFIISFMLIGLYWSIHHRMFGYVTNYSRKLIVLNLCFLFFIALMPFSTGFYSEYAGANLAATQLKIPMTFYVMNYFMAGLFTYFIWSYISNFKNGMTEQPIDPLIVKKSKVRSLVVPVVFLTMIPVAYLVNVLVAVYIPMLIPIILRVTNRMVLGKNHSSLRN